LNCGNGLYRRKQRRCKDNVNLIDETTTNMWLDAFLEGRVWGDFNDDGDEDKITAER
jgi:hypothetical protein